MPRRLLSILVSSGVVLAGSAVLATPARATFYGAVLPAGESLVAYDTSRNELYSPDGRFTLRMSGTGFELGETEELRGYGGIGQVAATWSGPRSSYRPLDRSRLTMQRNGNLVLRTAAGKYLWSTHTAGTGARDYLQLTNAGTLLIRTSSGSVVWNSHTSAIYLVAGQHLRSGQRLIFRNSGFPTVRLLMLRSGDLELTRNGHLFWHSKTHAPGSHVSLTANGRLAVVSPKGRVTWRTPAQGYGSYAHITQDGRLVVRQIHRRTCWQRPAPVPPNDCESG